MRRKKYNYSLGGNHQLWRYSPRLLLYVREPNEGTEKQRFIEMESSKEGENEIVT